MFFITVAWAMYRQLILDDIITRLFSCVGVFYLIIFDAYFMVFYFYMYVLCVFVCARVFFFTVSLALFIFLDCCLPFVNVFAQNLKTSWSNFLDHTFFTTFSREKKYRTTAMMFFSFFSTKHVNIKYSNSNWVAANNEHPTVVSIIWC